MGGQGGQRPKHPPSQSHVALHTLSPLSVAFWQQAWSALQEFAPTSPVLYWQTLPPLQESSPPQRGPGSSTERTGFMGKSGGSPKASPGSVRIRDAGGAGCAADCPQPTHRRRDPTLAARRVRLAWATDARALGACVYLGGTTRVPICAPRCTPARVRGRIIARRDRQRTLGL